MAIAVFVMDYVAQSYLKPSHSREDSDRSAYHHCLFIGLLDNQAEYADTSTLSARINHHCRLLATIKTAAKPLAAANGGGLHSFAGTPMSSTVGRSSSGSSSSTAVPGQQPCRAQPSQAVRGDVTAGEGDSGERAAPPVGSGGVAGTPPPYAPGGLPAGAGTEIAMASPSLVRTAFSLTGPHQEQKEEEELRGEEGGNGSTSPRSSHGETTEDDMDDEEEDESGDGHDDDEKPGHEVQVIATADRSLRDRDAGGIGPGPMQEDERQHAQQQQHMVEVLAAASSLGRQTGNENDETLPGKAPQVHELLEDGHGYEMEMEMMQQHPKATEAVRLRTDSSSSP